MGPYENPPPKRPTDRERERECVYTRGLSAADREALREWAREESRSLDAHLAHLLREALRRRAQAGQP